MTNMLSPAGLKHS